MKTYTKTVLLSLSMLASCNAFGSANPELNACLAKKPWFTSQVAAYIQCFKKDNSIVINPEGETYVSLSTYQSPEKINWEDINWFDDVSKVPAEINIEKGGFIASFFDKNYRCTQVLPTKELVFSKGLDCKSLHTALKSIHNDLISSLYDKSKQAQINGRRHLRGGEEDERAHHASMTKHAIRSMF